MCSITIFTNTELQRYLTIIPAYFLFTSLARFTQHIFFLNFKILQLNLQKRIGEYYLRAQSINEKLQRYKQFWFDLAEIIYRISYGPCPCSKQYSTKKVLRKSYYRKVLKVFQIKINPNSTTLSKAMFVICYAWGGLPSIVHPIF